MLKGKVNDVVDAINDIQHRINGLTANITSLPAQVSVLRIIDTGISMVIWIVCDPVLQIDSLPQFGQQPRFDAHARLLDAKRSMQLFSL